MRIRFAAVTILVAAAAPNSARSDERVLVRLSLEETLDRAVDRSPLVQRSRLDKHVVAAAAVGARVLMPSNPLVTALVGHRSETTNAPAPAAEGVQFQIHVEQAVEIGGQRSARIDEAHHALTTAQARERLAVVETRARARTSYLAVRIAEAQADSATRRSALGQRLLDSARARLNAGASSDVELHLAEVENGRLAAERLQAQLAVGDTSGTLRLILGLPLDAPLELTTPLSRPEAPSQALEALVEEARRRRAELDVLDESRSMLDAQIKRLRREVIPNPILAFDLQRDLPGQTFIGGTLGLYVPLWRRNQGELATARAEQARIDGLRALTDRDIGAEVAQALRAALSRAEETALWETQIVPAADANVELLTRGWQAGKFDLFRVIQASREAGEARRRHLEVLGGLWQAVIELDRATGAR